MTSSSQRDVVFTPFMLRVRDAVRGVATEPLELRFERSAVCSIAAAVDEWVELRTYAEQMIAEANAMLDADTERISLEDEHGTGELAFQLGWRGRRFRLLVDRDPRGETARLEMGGAFDPRPEKPAGVRALDDLIIDMLTQASQGGADDG